MGGLLGCVLGTEFLKEVRRRKIEQRENLNFTVAIEDSTDNIGSWDGLSGLSCVKARGTDLCLSLH